MPTTRAGPQGHPRSCIRGRTGDDVPPPRGADRRTRRWGGTLPYSSNSPSGLYPAVIPANAQRRAHPYPSSPHEWGPHRPPVRAANAPAKPRHDGKLTATSPFLTAPRPHPRCYVRTLPAHTTHFSEIQQFQSLDPLLNLEQPLRVAREDPTPAEARWLRKVG